MKTFVSLFTGIGGADFGLEAAGLTSLWGIEKDPLIAKASAINHQTPILVGSIRDYLPQYLKRPDLLWMSPPCQDWSTANHRRDRKSTRATIGQFCIKYIEVLEPQWVVLENVTPYRHAPAFKQICDRLLKNGYQFDWHMVDAADYGVPQNRKRLILRAAKESLLPQFPGSNLKKTSWYEAISDLIPNLPDSTFTQWQQKTLPVKPEPNLLIKRSGARSAKLTYRRKNQPSFTVRAMGGDRHWRWGDCFDAQGKIKRMTPRCSARLQTIPDWVRLPEDNVLAQKMVGNAVPSKLAEIIANNLVIHP